jgi:hypothetical protein
MQLCKYFLLATGLTCCNINSEGEEENASHRLLRLSCSSAFKLKKNKFNPK